MSKTKFGVVIPNTIIPRATKRKLVKRRILAVLSNLFSKELGLQCIVSVKVNIEKKTMKLVRDEIVKVFDVVSEKSHL